ncbi:unnamed protein product, partial [Choristocarpus tenellus]
GTDVSESLYEWAMHYRGVALLGGLALLLSTGKFISYYWDRIPLLRRTVIPPAAIAGLLGCAIYRVFSGLLEASGVKSLVDEGLSEVVVNLINFTFVAFMLGFASMGTYVPRTRVVLHTIWHEAMPMLIYSQVLIWGQSCMALGVVGLFRLGNPEVSPYLGALVTLGLETGRDVTAFSSARIVGEWAHEAVQLADSIGLLLSILAGVVLVTLHKQGQWG